MSLIRIHTSLLLLFFLALTTAQSPFQKQYYVDSDSTASETGDINQPFHSLASVFTAIEQDITQAEPTQSAEITISIKESSSIVVSDSVRLSLNRPSSVLKLNTYSSDSSKQLPDRATLQFKGATAHLGLSLQQSKLVIQDLHFRAEITEKLNNAELVLIEVPNGEATFVKCDFSDIRVDFQDSNTPVINLTGGRYLVKNCLFNDLTLASSLFQAQDSPKSLIKFELNDIRSVTTTNCALIKVSSLSSADFVENKIQNTNGRLIQVNTAKYVLFNNNTFSEVKGETPLDFASVDRVIVGDNTFTYDNQNSEGHNGLLSFTNFESLFVTSNTLKGYSGSTSPIKATTDSSKADSSVKIIGSNFAGNSLIVKDADSQGLSLFSMNLANEARITIQDTTFESNSIVDNRADNKQVLNVASTIYIDARDAELQVYNTLFNANKASRFLRNSYVNAKEITVEKSNFTSNTQIKKGDRAQDNQVNFRSFLWFGDDITFVRDEFKENYADEGAAIGIFQADGGKIASEVSIHDCNFERNEAKNGAAIFTDYNNEQSSVIHLESNIFTDNKADKNPDYSKDQSSGTTTDESTTPAIVDPAPDTSKEQETHSSGEQEPPISYAPLNKQYYVDTDSTASEGGDINQPFHSLLSAFTAVEKDVRYTDSAQPVEIIVSIKEGSSVGVSEAVVLSLTSLDRPSSVMKINTYSSDPSKQLPDRATIQFKGPAAHLALLLQKTKLVVQDIQFRADIAEKLNNPELILIQIPSGEATLMKCDFSNIRADFQNADTPVFNLSGGRYLVKSCLFSDLNIANPLLQVQNTPKGLVKFEFNEIRGVTTTNCALVKALSLSSLDFVENKIQNTNGRLIQINTANYVIFNNNTFSEVKGETPLDFTSVTKVILGDNSFTYDSANSEGFGGLLSFTNFDFLFVTNNLLRGYSGSSSPFKTIIDESYTSKSDAVVKIIGSSFTGNALTVKDADSQGLALLNMKFANKLHITIQDVIFDSNSIIDKRADTKQVLNAVSTLYVDAEEAQLNIYNTNFNANKASRSLRNSYVNAKEITVEKSNFTSNNQIKTGDSAQDNQVTFKSFLWFGETITFKHDDFKENYADQGGAVGIYQVDGERVADHVLIQACNFVQNEAKNGGAIFSDVRDSRLSEIQLEDNTFTDNKADENPDYGKGQKISENEKIHIYMEVISDDNKPTVYESNEFTVENAISQEPIDTRFRFYVAEYKHTESESSGKYITSLQIDDETQIAEGEEVLLTEAFKDKETGSSWGLNSLTMKAPIEANVALKVTMAKKSDPSAMLTFLFHVKMIRAEIKCARGEFYLHKHKHCVKCPAGTYSFAENAECLECPVGADCSEGGDQVKLLPGFWRDVAEADALMIFQCPEDSHCVGGFNSGCEEGYTGTLCNTCDRGGAGKPKYRPFSPNTCKTCEPIAPAEILGDFIAIALPVIVLLYTVHALISLKAGGEASKKRFSQCLYINLFVGYTQNVFILSTLGYISMPASVMTLVNIIANPSFATFGSLTCYLDDVDGNFMKILAVFSLIPVAKALLVFITVKCIVQRTSTTRATALSLIWLSFLEAPGFLDFILRLFDCHQLGNNIHSRFNFGPQCTSEGFNEVRLYILFPLVVLTAIANPLMVTYALTKGSLRSDEHEEQKRLKTMLLAKSSENIVKSERSWFYFAYAAFGRLGLLLLATSEENTAAGYLTIFIYYISLVLMNGARRVASFDGWRSGVLSVDALFVVVNLVLGSLINFVDYDLREHFVDALWIINAIYVAVLYGARLIGSDDPSYNKLEDSRRDPMSPPAYDYGESEEFHDSPEKGTYGV